MFNQRTTYKIVEELSNIVVSESRKGVVRVMLPTGNTCMDPGVKRVFTTVQCTLTIQLAGVPVNPLWCAANLITANFYFVSSELPLGLSAGCSDISEHNTPTVYTHCTRI
jgi:hypothetical protein